MHDEKLFFYMRLGTADTDLSVTLWVDDCGAYKMDAHPLLLFVSYTENDAQTITFFPVSVSDCPRILDADIAITLSDTVVHNIKSLFIIANASVLADFANSQLPLNDFFAQYNAIG